ncbi:MAG: hypothetical protein JSS11_17175 [Verrucomicrobia bacterium]|nr:hypothetical protein [Verrucomicrobiota bacterium]
MNWIFEHLQIVVAIIAAIAYMLKRNKPEDEAASDPGEDEERSRKIREEIRRKIAERREGGAAPATPPPVLRPQSRPALQPVDPFGGPPKAEWPTLRKKEPEPAATPPPVPQPSMAAVLERQARLAEQMKELERARAEKQRQAAEVRSAAAEQKREAAAGAAGDGRDAWLKDLRSAQGLRRAIVQREVLGPPVALR